MAEFLWNLRQYRSLQDVIDAIRDYLDDPANRPGTDPRPPDISDLNIRRIIATVFPSGTTFAQNQTREVTITVELADGTTLDARDVGALISSNIITYQWGRAAPGMARGPVATVTDPAANSNTYIITCIHDGIGTVAERRDTLTFTLRDATGRAHTAVVTLTAEERRFATGITLPSEIRMLCGETQMVTATLTPSQPPPNVPVTWSVSPATGIVSIRPTADGRCEVIANNNNVNGIAILSASVARADGTTISAQTRVMVFRDANDVVVDPTSIIMLRGSFRDIAAYTYSPTSILSWVA